MTEIYTVYYILGVHNSNNWCEEASTFYCGFLINQSINQSINKLINLFIYLFIYFQASCNEFQRKLLDLRAASIARRGC